MKKSAAFSAAGSLAKRQRRQRQIGRLDLARAVVAGAQFGDAARVDVEADHRRARARKRDRDRQADIAKADHGDLAAVRHSVLPFSRKCGLFSWPLPRPAIEPGCVFVRLS